MPDVLDLAQRVADRLVTIDGVVAVSLGGSHARGTASADSDIDLGIYYGPASPPAAGDLRLLAGELATADSASTVTEIGEWGPWINGGAWLEIEGQRVDWLYRDLDRVGRVIGECRAGKTAWHYQPGHPYAFCNHIYPGEVYYCRVLNDPGGVLAGLKWLVQEYPPLLKRAILDHVWEAQFALNTARKAAGRGDPFYVAGCLFRCAAVLTDVVFALNERYWVNEKGAVRAAAELDIRPERFDERINRVLANLGKKGVEIVVRLEEMDTLVGELKVLCNRV